MKRSTLNELRSGLVVSCQAHGGHPLRDPYIIGALGECAVLGGAAGIRADGPQDIWEITNRVQVPVIGIYKVPLDEERFLITPTFEHAREIVEAGADIVALEATFENRPDDELEGLTGKIKTDLRVPVMADVSTFDEGRRAWELGADLVGTTLSGYTRESRGSGRPDLALVEKLSEAGVRVVCEGHVGTPDQAAAAFGRGAWCVVVGTAITDPISITARFVEAAREGEGS